MATEPFLGTWKVVEVVPTSQHPEIPGLEGVEFTLQDDGDVTWKFGDKGALNTILVDPS